MDVEVGTVGQPGLIHHLGRQQFLFRGGIGAFHELQVRLAILLKHGT